MCLQEENSNSRANADNCNSYHFCYVSGQRWTNMAQSPNVEIWCLTNLGNMLIERHYESLGEHLDFLWTTGVWWTSYVFQCQQMLTPCHTKWTSEKMAMHLQSKVQGASPNVWIGMSRLFFPPPNSIHSSVIFGIRRYQCTAITTTSKSKVFIATFVCELAAACLICNISRLSASSWVHRDISDIHKLSEEPSTFCVQTTILHLS